MFAKSDKDNRIVRREETNEKLKVSARKLQQKFQWYFPRLEYLIEINLFRWEVLISEKGPLSDYKIKLYLLTLADEE